MNDINLIESESVTMFSQLFEDMRHTETTYLKNLSELIACCQYNTTLVQHALQVDIAINSNLKTIASSLLSSHLFLKQRILTLEDSDPLLLVNFVNWLSEVAPLYQQYINFYKFDPDQPEKEVHLKRRPLVRIRYITKVLRNISELNINSRVQQSVQEFYEQFSQELSNARDKDDTERQKVAANTITFDDVRCLETMELTASNFKLSELLMRDKFQLSLKHPQRIAKLEMNVELFALADPYSTAHDNEEAPIIDKIQSLAICSVEKLGRSLLFPPFRFEELKISNLEDDFDFSSQRGMNVVLVPYFADIHNPEIVINLKIDKSANYNEWLRVFNKLFQANSLMKQQTNNNLFTKKHKQLISMKNGKHGLDIRVPLPHLEKLVPQKMQVPFTSKTVSLHKSKKLNPSLEIPKDIQKIREIDEQQENRLQQIYKTGQQSVVEKLQRKVLSNKTNIPHSWGVKNSPKQPMHAYRALMFHNMAGNQKPLPSINPVSKPEPREEEEKLEHDEEIIIPVDTSFVESNISMEANAPLTMKQNLLDSPAFADFNKVAVNKSILQDCVLTDELSPKSVMAITEHVTPGSLTTPGSLRGPLDIDEKLETTAVTPMKLEVSSSPRETIKPSENSISLNNIISQNSSTTSFLDLEALGNIELPFAQPEKKQRRKSIFSVFGLKKKSTTTKPLKPERNPMAAPLNNCSSTTLTTQETITNSKSTRNINKLTIDTSFLNNPKLHQSPEFENNSLKKIQTAVTTPGSLLPSPFAFPTVESPAVEISEDLRLRLKNSRSLCQFSCRVSRWNENKWELIGGKEISINVVVNEDGGLFVGTEDSSEKALVVLPISNSTIIRRSTALDIQLKTKENASSSRFTSTLIRCSIGSQAETLIKALEISKQDLNRPMLSTKNSVTSLNSSMLSSSVSSQSILSKDAFNSMTSITNNNNLTDDIFSLGRPKLGNAGGMLISPSAKNFNSPTDLYFTPPTSAVDLSFNTALSSPAGSQSQLLLLLSTMKIRVHEKVSTKWQPKAISTLELYALESVPNFYHLKISGTPVEDLIKSENVLRVGKAGVLLTIPKYSDEESLEYMLEFKGKKIADEFYEIVGK